MTLHRSVWLVSLLAALAWGCDDGGSDGDDLGPGGAGGQEADVGAPEDGGAGGAGDGCGAISFIGCCEGQVLRYCNEGTVDLIDCADAPACGWAGESGYDCETDGGADPSGEHPQACSEVGGQGGAGGGAGGQGGGGAGGGAGGQAGGGGQGGADPCLAICRGHCGDFQGCACNHCDNGFRCEGNDCFENVDCIEMDDEDPGFSFECVDGFTVAPVPAGGVTVGRSARYMINDRVAGNGPSCVARWHWDYFPRDIYEVFVHIPEVEGLPLPVTPQIRYGYQRGNGGERTLMSLDQSRHKGEWAQLPRRESIMTSWGQGMAVLVKADQGRGTEDFAILLDAIRLCPR